MAREPGRSRVITSSNALKIAGVALVIGVGLEVAFNLDITNSAARYVAEHPGGDNSPFCQLAQSPGGAGNLFLFLGASIVLLVGGIVCLVLALWRKSPRSPVRGWAVAAGVVEIVLALAFAGFNFLGLYGRGLACGLG